MSTTRKVWYGSLRLAADDCFRLRDPGLEPDPLSPLSLFMGTLDREQGERVKLAADFWPVDPPKVVRRRKRQLEMVKSGRVELDREEQRWLEATCWEDNVAFRILVRAEAPTTRRAREIVTKAAWQFGAFTNGTKQSFTLDKRWLRQRMFARWFASGPSTTRAPASGWVPMSALRGLIKPPTRHCAGRVLRSAPLTGLRPRGLQHFEAADLRAGRIQPRRGWMPWGLDPDHTKPGQERVLVVSEPDTLFTWAGGKSGFGKSETTMARFVYLARAGHGCLFLDPHSDAVNKLKPYLGPVADRVVELALDSSQPEQIAAWNPFDLPSEWSPDCDVTPAEWRTQMGAAEALIHDTYFGFQRWHETKETRAGPIFNKAVSALLHASPLLSRENRPTLFSVIDMLDPDDRSGLRAAVIPTIPSKDRDFWERKFARESGADLVPTRPLENLVKSPLIRSFVGSSVASYRMADLINDNKIVLVRIGGDGTRDKEFLASVIVYDVLTAMKQRRDILDVNSRPPFHLFLDEVPDYDAPLGNALRNAINQSRKFGLRVHLISQYIDAMQPGTKGALAANRTHLMSSACDQKTATWFLKETASELPADALTKQARYTFMSEVSQDGHYRPLFNCGGLTIDMLFGQPPGHVDGLQQQIDANSGLRPTRDTAERLETLPKRIAKELAANPDRLNILAGGKPRDRTDLSLPSDNFARVKTMPGAPDSGNRNDSGGASAAEMSVVNDQLRNVPGVEGGIPWDDDPEMVLDLGDEDADDDELDDDEPGGGFFWEFGPP